MNHLESALEKMESKMTGDGDVANRLEGHLDDLDYIRKLMVKDILPSKYEEMLYDLVNDDDMTISFLRGVNDAEKSLKEIENEELGVILPWDYLDGPYTFELGGREKKKIMLTFLKKLLVSYGMPEAVVEEISRKKW